MSEVAPILPLSIPVPDKSLPVPRGWAEDHVLPVIREIYDTEQLWGAGSNIQGLIAQHKARGHDVQELQAGKLFIEIRIGELLGPTTPGERTDLDLTDTRKVFSHQLRHELRALAWYEREPVDHIAIESVRNGSTSRGKVIRGIEDQMPRAVFDVAAVEIRAGRFQDVLSDIPDGSVDLILTDPPYPAEFLDEWSDLADFAADKLVDGGSLLAYSGHGNLPQVIERLSKRLRYWWIIALLHGHGSANLPGKFVTIGWKPIVWFVKRNRRDSRYVADRLTGSPPRKLSGPVPEWSQGQGEIDPLIQSLTSPGELIVDPFAGSGTVGHAALALKRRFIGAERG